MRSRIQRLSSTESFGVESEPSNFCWIQRFSSVDEMYMYSMPIVPQ